MVADFPDDSDGTALEMLAAGGLEMNSPVRFEFSIHVADEASSKTVLDSLKAAGVGEEIEAVFDEGELDNGEAMTKENEESWPSWTVYVYQSMIPSYEGVVRFQEVLKGVCRDNGKLEGWTVEVD